MQSSDVLWNVVPSPSTLWDMDPCLRRDDTSESDRTGAIVDAG
jgi:hypothetical protein